MSNLIKIKAVSDKYDITARTLRYYEDMGLIASTRSDDYAYRMYDEEAVKRLEQILILRKLNISIKDIQRIFSASGSEVVLDVLGKKVQNIDDEVALLHELKDIVLEFIREIERVDFADNSDIKALYGKAKEIESHLTNVEYIGKPSNVSRLIEITEKLDKKIPDIMIVRLPPMRVVTTGAQPWDKWSKFDELMGWGWQEERRWYFREIIFDCIDLLQFSESGFEYILAVKDEVSEVEASPYSIVEFPGGLYAMAVSIDDDDESREKVDGKMQKWLESTNFEYDRERRVMGAMAYEGADMKEGLGYQQFPRFMPIKLKGNGAK